MRGGMGVKNNEEDLKMKHRPLNQRATRISRVSMMECTSGPVDTRCPGQLRLPKTRGQGT